MLIRFVGRSSYTHKLSCLWFFFFKLTVCGLYILHICEELARALVFAFWRLLGFLLSILEVLEIKIGLSRDILLLCAE